MHSLDEIRRSVSRYEPEVLDALGRRRAAVAMVLCAKAGRPEVLFIERARRAGDPWSGHMAFPGGRIDGSDPTARAAAERETLEEVGLPLAGADPLGRLDDMQGHPAAGALVVSAFVYHLSQPAQLVTNDEVEQAFWFPLAGLLESDRHVDYPLRDAQGRSFPGIRVGHPERHVVWGLTYRFLETFFQVLGTPFPDRWQGLRSGSGS